ncbi:hypothetical protein K7H20_13670, partial [Salipiger manganoxidans]|uniref:hypothetical protein n=1 Tax=Salipiger marinus TaxID=555512 RepID=UPI001E53946A
MSIKQAAQNRLQGSPVDLNKRPPVDLTVDLFRNVRHTRASVAALEADTAISRTAGAADYVDVGDIVQAGDLLFRVAPDDAETPHRINANSVKFYVNANKYELRAEAFGVRFDGNDESASANRAALQMGCDYLYAEGQGGRISLASDGDVRLDRPVFLRDGMILDGGGCQIKNITAADSGVTPGESAIGIGSVGRQDSDKFTWHRAQAITAGDDAVVMQTAGDTAAYQVGDLVWAVKVDGVPTWGTETALLHKSHVGFIS